MSGDAWQPIETAPRDGTEVLTYDPEGKMTRVDWFGHSSIAPGWLGTPTHWQPLPAPPKDADSA